MEKTLGEIAALVGGELEGDGSLAIRGVAGIKEAGPGEITFLSNPKYQKELACTRASAVIVAPGTDMQGRAGIRVKNPYFAFSKVVRLFAPAPKPPMGVMGGAHVCNGARLAEEATVYPGAYVSDGASVGRGSVLYPGVYVGEGSEIGEGCTLYPNVVVREGVRIGNRVIIHAGTVVGADGFGYAMEGGRHHKIPQIGGVVIEDDVEIGANSAIDRGALGDTVIKRGSKIDNLVMVAHNVVVGEDCIIVAQAGISGSTELGHHVVLAGQVGLVGHIKIGDMVTVGAQSGVMNDLASGQLYSGSPALPHKEWLKAQAVLPKLPEMRKTLIELAKKMAELEGDRDQTGRK